METNLNIVHNAALHAVGDRLLNAAMEYWREYCRVTGGAAVVWLSDTDGRLVILTRGEYREQLMQNIQTLQQDVRSHKKPLRSYDDVPPSGI